MTSPETRVCVLMLENTKGESTNTLLQRLAVSFLRAPEDRVSVARTEKGKPFFPCMPSVNVAVSHSGPYFVCAFSDVPVGVDIQEHASLETKGKENVGKRALRIAERFFHKSETEFVRVAPEQRFFAVFTAKESYVKFTGRGIDADFSRFSVLPENVDLLAEGTQNGGEIRWHSSNAFFSSRTVKDGYTLTVCTALEATADITVIEPCEN